MLVAAAVWVSWMGRLVEKEGQAGHVVGWQQQQAEQEVLQLARRREKEGRREYEELLEVPTPKETVWAETPHLEQTVAETFL